jgi:hypothetical protein
MLVACRLSGLSALEGHYAGVSARAISPCGKGGHKFPPVCAARHTGRLGSEGIFPFFETIKAANDCAAAASKQARGCPCETNCRWIGQPCASLSLSCLVRDGAARPTRRAVPLEAGMFQKAVKRPHDGQGSLPPPRGRSPLAFPVAAPSGSAVIRISISVEAFEAIARTLPFGSVAYETEADAKGEMHIWIDDRWADKLAAMREPGESYSDAILRLTAAL